MIRGSTYSAIMHMTILLVILFGLPSLTFLIPFLNPPETPVRVVVMTEKDAQELAKKAPSESREKAEDRKKTEDRKSETEETPVEASPAVQAPSTPTTEDEPEEPVEDASRPRPAPSKKQNRPISVVKEADPKSDTNDKVTTTRNPSEKKQEAVPQAGTGTDTLRGAKVTQKSAQESNRTPGGSTPAPPQATAATFPPVTMVLRPASPAPAPTQQSVANRPATQPMPATAASAAKPPQAPAAAAAPAPSRPPPDRSSPESKAVDINGKASALPVPTGQSGDVKAAPAGAETDAATTATKVAAVMAEMASKVPRLQSLREQLDKPDPGTRNNPATEQVARRMEARASEGYAHAQFTLAELYLTGEGLPRNEKKAIELLNRAAISGFLPAQLTLGMLAAEGKSTERNLAEAHTWLAVAADQGNRAAMEALPKLEKLMTARDAVEARKRSSQVRQVMVLVHGGNLKNVSKSELNERVRVAAALGDVESVHVLLAQGADADAADLDGRTAVIEAAWRGYPKIVKSLIDNGANLSATDSTKKNAVMWAAINGHADVIKNLIAAGAVVNERDDEGITALMRAAWNSHAKAVEALLQAGSDPRIRDNKGLSAYDYAGKAGNATIQRLLGQAGGR